MKKNIFLNNALATIFAIIIGTGLMGMIILPAFSQNQETITISTYYPSPNGVYFTMEVTKDLIIDGGNIIAGPSSGGTISVRDPITKVTEPVMQITTEGVVFLKKIIIADGQDIILRNLGTSPSTVSLRNALKNAEAVDQMLYNQIIIIARSLSEVWESASQITTFLGIYYYSYALTLIGISYGINKVILDILMAGFDNPANYPEWWP